MRILVGIWLNGRGERGLGKIVGSSLVGFGPKEKISGVAP